MVIGMMFFSRNMYGAVRTWNGSVSSDWNTAANWNEGSIPTINDDVVISLADPYRDCELTSSVTIKSLRIEVSYGSEFILPSDKTLSITGDLYIDAPFLPWQNTSNIILIGTTDQNITVTDPFGDYYFFDLTINKTSGSVILGSDITITGTFTNLSSTPIDYNGFSIIGGGCITPQTGSIYSIPNNWAL